MEDLLVGLQHSQLEAIRGYQDGCTLVDLTRTALKMSEDIHVHGFADGLLKMELNIFLERADANMRELLGRLNEQSSYGEGLRYAASHTDDWEQLSDRALR